MRSVITRRDAGALGTQSIYGAPAAADEPAVDHGAASSAGPAFTLSSNVAAAKKAAAAAVAEPDKYTSRLMKYIPAEVIALYVTLEAFMRSAAQMSLPLYWFIFIFGAAVTPLYLWRVGGVSKKLQLAISTVAFIVWVFALGGPFVSLGWYNPLYGAVLLPIYTFLIPILEA